MIQFFGGVQQKEWEVGHAWNKLLLSFRGYWFDFVEHQRRISASSGDHKRVRFESHGDNDDDKEGKS